MTDPNQAGHGGVVDGAVDHSPLEEGTDPLGDRAVPYRRQGRLVLGAVLCILFLVLAVTDYVTGHIARGIVGTLTAVLSGYIAVKERGKPKPPSETAT